MWRKIGPLLLILSFTLNLAFTGTWVVSTLQRKTVPNCGARPGSGEIWCPLHRRLGISGSQWRQIEPRMRAFSDSTLVQCERMRSLRSELVDLLAAEHTDHEAIAAKQVEILNGQKEMQERVIDHLLAQKLFLKPPQRTKLFQMMKERLGCASGGNSTPCPLPISSVDSAKSSK